ncbi:MAG: choice-of-anchor J domain-containing protein [Bacteroidales bacterium]|nr:choice-of-anchor J domain-containing protein [Bacteroidales bacterium]
MKKKLLAIVLGLLPSLYGSAQVLLNESFSSGIPSSWTLWNDGNAPHNSAYAAAAWVSVSQVGNPAPCAGSTSYFRPAATANRWLITPPLTIPDTGYRLSFDVACANENYPDGLLVLATANPDATLQNQFTDTLLALPAATGEFLSHRVRLNAFAGSAIRIAFVENSRDLSNIYVDNVKIGAPYPNEVEAAELEAPRYHARQSDLHYKFTITNKGVVEIDSMDVRFFVDDVLVDSSHIGGMHLRPHGTDGFSAYSVEGDIAVEQLGLGTHVFCAEAVRPNGMVDEAVNNRLCTSFHLYDGGISVPRRTLLEMFVTAQSGWSPSATNRVRQALVGDTSTIWINHHAGYGADSLTCAASSALLPLFAAEDETYCPAIMYDRTCFYEARSPLSLPGTLDSIRSRLCLAAEVPAYVSLSIDSMVFSATDSLLHAVVHGVFPDAAQCHPSLRLTIYLVQDSLYLAQTDYTSDTFVSYALQSRTVREALTAPWGDPIALHHDGTFSRQVFCRLPHHAELWNCRFVAFVSDSAAAMNQRQVYNAALSAAPAWLDPVALASVPLPLQMKIYPNPAHEYVVVEANQPMQWVQLYDARGILLTTWSPVANRCAMKLPPVPAGIYLLRATTPAGTLVHRFSILR